MFQRSYRRYSSYPGRIPNQQIAPTAVTYTPNQIALQTFLENGLVPSRSIDFAKNIAYTRRPSSKQVYWIDKLVNDAMQDKPASPIHAPMCNVSKIFTLFDNAAKNKLKYPRAGVNCSGK